MTPTLSILGIIAIAVLASGFFGWRAYQSIVVRGEPMFPAFSAKAAAKPAFKEHCLGKVTYIQFDTGVIVKVKPDGKVWTCGGV